MPVFVNDHETGLGYCGGTLAVGSVTREVGAEMTALSASAVAAASASGPARRNKMDAARAGRWLPTAADGPVGGLADRTTGDPAEMLACSRRCGHGTGTVARAVRLLPASAPTAVACCARRAQPGRGRRTAPDCINFARRVRRRGGQRGATGASLFVPHAEDPRPRISRDIRCHDPPGAAYVRLAARGVRAMQRTMPPAPARPIRAQ